MLKNNSICDICQKPFYSSPGHKTAGWGKYCSIKCRSVAMTGDGNSRWLGKKAECICKTCGIIFRCKPSHIEKGEGIYCSRNCQFESHRKRKVVCKNCGKIFETYPSYKSYYCSRKCVGEAKNTKIKRFCITCNKEFLIKRCETLRKDKNGVGSFCSNECKAKQMSKNPLTVFGKIRGSHGGKRNDLNLYVRSGWEANYARYLNFLVSKHIIESWEYEPDTFEFPVKRGSKFYTPDFKIININKEIEYHEVKGYLDAQSQTKLRRMNKYYPDINMQLIDSNVYHTIRKQFEKIIENWE